MGWFVHSSCMWITSPVQHLFPRESYGVPQRGSEGALCICTWHHQECGVGQGGAKKCWQWAQHETALPHNSQVGTPVSRHVLVLNSIPAARPTLAPPRLVGKGWAGASCHLSSPTTGHRVRQMYVDVCWKVWHKYGELSGGDCARLPAFGCLCLGHPPFSLLCNRSCSSWPWQVILEFWEPHCHSPSLSTESWMWCGCAWGACLVSWRDSELPVRLPKAWGNRGTCPVPSTHSSHEHAAWASFLWVSCPHPTELHTWWTSTPWGDLWPPQCKGCPILKV